MNRAERRRTAGTYRRQPVSTWAFTALIALAVAWLWPFVASALAPVAAPWRLPWVVLAAGFTVGQVCAIRFEWLGENHEMTLSEVPLIVGLVFVGPDRLLLATAVGSVAAVLWNRHAPIKAVFNVLVSLLETVVAALCFHAVLGHGGAISLTAFAAVVVAVPGANLASAVCIQVVISLSLSSIRHIRLTGLAPVLLGVAVLNVSAGLVAVVLLWVSPVAVLPFSLIAVVLGVGYRSHSELRRRHRDLEEMYRFSSALAELTDAEDVIGAVLGEARDRLRAGLAELALDGAEGTVRYTLRGDGPLIRSVESTPHPMRNAAAGRGVVAQRATAHEELVGALRSCGFRDAVAAPVPEAPNLSGILVVADRQSDQVSFERADLELLQVLAQHTTTALNAAQLLDWLRQEVAAKNHLALHDALTDLANRSLFNEQVEASLTGRVETAVVAVMLIDLDRFKEVNDTMGHQSGDVVLQQIAAQLTDAIGVRGSVGRLGGDEFAIVAVLEDRSEITALVRDVLAAAQASVAGERHHLDVGASVGVAIAPDHGHDRSTLLRCADAAMYRAKAKGGGAEFFEAEHYARAGESLGTGGGYWTAIEHPST